ncbi:MAG: flagellar hook-associated protein FlgK [Desulfovibrionaceae bacterium]
MPINALFNIGNSALYASQASIQSTGNNIANVNTPGYSRQYVRLEDANYIQGRPGAMGQGVNPAEVLRRFNKFLEKSYLEKSSTASRWNEQANTMASVENLFNEANRAGISSKMGAFFKAWDDLGLRPEDIATRQNLISSTDNMTLLLRDSADSLRKLQREMDQSIQDNTDKVNNLVESIAEINKQIRINTVNGVSNPNGLMDKRDLLVRQLSESIDITVDDRGGGDYTVRTSAGMPLVEGTEHYAIELMGPRAETHKGVDSTYSGEIIFAGSDSHEYTVEMVNGGNMGDVPPPAFRVSLDGGKTWLRDDNGQEINYNVTDIDGNGTMDPVTVKNLQISFNQTDNFSAGDRFTIVPKDGLYWIEPTRGPINITPQINFDGTDNGGRITGGKLTSYFNVRDDNCGRYLDELDAVAKAMIWEVNSLHSQGAGLEKLNYLQGTERVAGNTIPLGTPQSGLAFADRLTEGNINFNIYNKENGAFISGGPLNFGIDPVTGDMLNFDPAVHSVNDVAAAINRTFLGQLNASVQNGQLFVNADPAAVPPVQFSMGQDTTGVMAALGLNTFFQGSNASDIAMNADLHTNPNRINAGAVNGAHEINVGDASIAQSISGLTKKNIRISTAWKTSDKQTLQEYYSGVVATVGADTRTAKTNRDYNIALATDLDERQASIAGVNVDEEMANLIKFQHSYTAAAKLITTADQMLQTLLGLKQ